jgi:hypothetical protein
VAARISAKCTVRTPDRIRDNPPPICIKHDESPALHTSAPELMMLVILSASIAVDVSEFLIANVPPKPQH